MIDDRFVQRVADSTGGDQNMAGGAEVELTGGPHVLTLLRAGGSARPGDGAPGRLIQTLLEPVDAQRAPRAWDPADWRSLCNPTDVDWLEVRQR